jgi:hypothetical protein
MLYIRSVGSPKLEPPRKLLVQILNILVFDRFLIFGVPRSAANNFGGGAFVRVN